MTYSIDGILWRFCESRAAFLLCSNFNRHTQARNSIARIEIGKLVRGYDGINVSMMMRRKIPAPVVAVIQEAEFNVDLVLRPDGPPERPPSKLPPPGNWSLSLSVGEIIGRGRCGTIFTTSLSRLSDPDGAEVPPAPPYLPELVVKVANPNHRDLLTKEAEFYYEMESLQGMSIPRCYGWFEVDLEDGMIIAEMDDEYADSDSDSDKKQDPITRTLLLLLLEKLGDRLPLGQRIPRKEKCVYLAAHLIQLFSYPSSTRKDLFDVFRDLARLGIQQNDIRYSNILKSPAAPPGLPTHVCRVHRRRHRYRVLDFDDCEKNNLSEFQHEGDTDSVLGAMLEGLEEGIIIEPWYIYE